MMLFDKFTIPHRCSVAPAKSHPLFFIAANGEPVRSLEMEEYAKISVTSEGKADKVATPDKKVLARFVRTAGVPFKAMTITTASAFQSRCLAHRHCLLLLTNTTSAAAVAAAASSVRAVTALSEGLAAAHRLLRVVVADAASLDFSLAHALPAEVPWSAHDSPAPRALYLRSLTTKEGAALGQAASPTPPPAELSGAGFDTVRGEWVISGLQAWAAVGCVVCYALGAASPWCCVFPLQAAAAVSRCSLAAIATAPNASAAAAVFEAKRVSPRQWALLGPGALDAKAGALDGLVFAIDGRCGLRVCAKGFRRTGLDSRLLLV